MKNAGRQGTIRLDRRYTYRHLCSSSTSGNVIPLDVCRDTRHILRRLIAGRPVCRLMCRRVPRSSSDTLVRLTILHSQFQTMGGAEVLLTSQARWLAAAGHDVRVVAFTVDPAYRAKHLADLHVTEVGLPGGVQHMEALTPAMMPELVERTRPALKDCDTVMALNYPSAPIAADASNARRVWYACEPYRSLYLREGNPAAAAHADRAGLRAEDFATRQVARRLLRRKVQHAMFPWTAAREQSLKQFDGAAIRGLDGVASLSRYAADCVRDATGRADASVVHPMIRFTQTTPHRHGICRDAPQILVQTRLVIPKNLDTLIRALVIVRRRHPRAQLHVVGTGPRRAVLEHLARRVAPGAVTFHGFLSDAALDTLCASCDLFAFAPVDEPFGMVFPEAAARGLLMVGSDHGGPREILEDGAIGELCNPFDAECVADAILRTLALSDTEADARRARADHSVRARFCADVTGRQLESLLQG